MSSPGFFKQWGTNIAETGHPEMTENRIKNEQNNLDFKIAPLRQQLAADQERLKTLVDSVGQPKLDANGKHADYDLIESRMAKTIGDIRQAAGDKIPSEHPGRMAETVNGIRQWLKTGGKNKKQLQAAQSGKVNDWNNQNTQMAGEFAVGAQIPANPYMEEKRQLVEAGFTPEQAQRAIENKVGLTPKLTSSGVPYQGTDGKWYQNFKDASGQISPREMPPNYMGPTTQDTKKRDDYEAFKKEHPTYKGSFEEWVKNPTGEAKLGTPRVGTSGGKNVYALLTDKGWVDAGTREPLKDFRPMPTFAQQGLYGIDLMQNADGSMSSALLNRRTGQFKPITASGGAPIAPQIFSQISKSIEPAVESDTRYRVMKDNEKDAMNGNQQAMLSLVANHMGMTLGQQKGTRINQAQWNEAIASAPWIEAQASKWFHQDANGDYIFDGYKSGVTITGDQVKQMVGLAQQRRLRQWQQAQQSGKIYGVNVPIPDDLDNPSSTLEGPKIKAIKGKVSQSKVDDFLSNFK